MTEPRKASGVTVTGHMFDLDGYIVRVGANGMLTTTHDKAGELRAPTIEMMSKRIAAANEDAAAKRKQENAKRQRQRRTAKTALPAILYNYDGTFEKVAVRGKRATRHSEALITLADGGKDTAPFGRLLRPDADTEMLAVLRAEHDRADKERDDYLKQHTINVPRNLYTSNPRFYSGDKMMPEADLPPDLEVVFTYDEAAQKGVFTADLPGWGTASAPSMERLTDAARWAWMTRDMAEVWVSPMHYDAYRDTERVARHQMVHRLLNGEEDINSVYDESFDLDHQVALNTAKSKTYRAYQDFLVDNRFDHELLDD